MKRRRGSRWHLETLGARIAAILTLALLPLGLIAVVQTYRLIGEATQRVDAALIGETLSATRPQRAMIQAGIGAAQTLAASLSEILDQTELCRETLGDFVEHTADIHFAGVVRADGQMLCASEGGAIDFSGSELWQSSVASPRIFVRATAAGRVTGRPAILVSAPIFDDEQFSGYVTLSLTHTPLSFHDSETSQFSAIDILTFNDAGEVMTSGVGLRAANSLLPVNRPLKSLVGSSSAIFLDVNERGSKAIYTVTPVVEDTVYAMAIWPPSVAPGAGDLLRWTLPTLVLPVMMWAVSLSVAFYAVHDLVIRHIWQLRKRMRLFSRFRRVEQGGNDATLPSELREVTDTFVTMALTIQRDEAELENSLREKDALLREVYHRVRNNLQLIASMNNMQMRAAKSDETRRALRRLQDRIMAMATIHSTLYQAPALAKIQADEMVVSLARQVAAKADASTAIEVTSETSKIMLHPDQAVPLSLLTVEAVSNAVKHLGQPTSERPPFIHVKLTAEEGVVQLMVQNSVSTPAGEARTVAAGGLGLQLINAFTVQLAGELEVEDGEETYTLSVSFRPSDYGEELSLV